MTKAQYDEIEKEKYNREKKNKELSGYLESNPHIDKKLFE